MAATNALESRIYASSVLSSHAVTQVLDPGVDDIENEEQKHLTKMRHGRAAALETGLHHLEPLGHQPRTC